MEEIGGTAPVKICKVARRKDRENPKLTNYI